MKAKSKNDDCETSSLVHDISFDVLFDQECGIQNHILSNSGSYFIMLHHVNRNLLAWILLVIDAIGILICFQLSSLFFQGTGIRGEWPYLLILIPAYIIGLYVGNTYRPGLRIGGLWSPARVIISILITVSLMTTIIYLAGLWGNVGIAGRQVFVGAALLFTFWAVSSRYISASYVMHRKIPTRWLIIGNPLIYPRFLEDIYAVFKGARITILASNQKEKLLLVQKLGSEYEIKTMRHFEALADDSYSHFAIADRHIRISDNRIRRLMELRLKGSIILRIVDFYEMFFLKIPPSLIEDGWLAYSAGFSLLHHPGLPKIKRLVDLLVSSSILLLTLPVTLLTALAIRIESSGDIFYTQIRRGRNGNDFKVIKFRTMQHDAEKLSGARWATPNDPRITRIGNFLRKTRIDELPQLWNVLKNEMSLIGPRPERPEFDANLEQNIPYYNIRYLVKPGITGWAQVLYPYGASEEDSFQKVAFDLYYLKNYSLVMDFAIILRTIRVVLHAAGR